jgi:hypothetical protein
VYALQSEYLGLKNWANEQLPHVDFDQDKLVAEYDRIVQDERAFLQARSASVLNTKIDAFRKLRNRIVSNTRHYIINIFLSVSTYPKEWFKKPAVAESLIRQGEEALTQERFELLRTITINLTHLVDGDDELETIRIKGTGIG